MKKTLQFCHVCGAYVVHWLRNGEWVPRSEHPQTTRHMREASRIASEQARKRVAEKK